MNNAVPAAGETLMQKVYLPHFFSKLASYGISPATEQDAEYMYRIGERLAQAEQLDAVKQAEASTSFYETASHYLDQVLGADGPVGRAESARIKQAAAVHMTDPAVVEAAITLQDAAFGVLQQ